MKYTFIAMFTVFNVAAYSQDQQSIVFDVISHDFGLISEGNGIVDHIFQFKNTGKDPVVIMGVNASCGCTTSGYTVDSVPPGGQGFVKASYNPYNRPGPFKKSLTVTTNGDPNIVTLYIEGNVKPMVRSIEDEYPTKLGALRVKFMSLNMGTIKNNAPVTRGFAIYNDSDLPVKFHENVKKPKYLSITFDPLVIEPKTTGSIFVTFDPTNLELGYIAENIVIQTNEPDQFRNKEMRIVATVEEYFPPMTADDMARAPRISVDKNQHDFGSIASGSNINAAFIITNTGHNPLKIRAVKSHCDCIAVEVDKEDLNKNDQAVIKAKFDTSGRQGNQLLSITIFTNDPQEPMKVVRIRGRVN